ncbi:MAG: hypothetical protein JXA19_07495 [Anaerolineales bacterium]|nr:hypothetical protein [Anaerolineales bacterium]
MRSFSYLKIFALVILILQVESACSQKDPGVSTAESIPPTPIETSTPTSVPVFSDPLVLCTASEPNTLNIQNSPNSSAKQILNILYDGPLNQNILFSIPPELFVETATVMEGDTILDVYGTPQQLYAGVEVYPSGCTTKDCIQTYTSGEIQLTQVSIRYTFSENVFWSDGEPLKAEDSIYAFQFNTNNTIPGNNSIISKTMSYQVVESSVVEWVGLPGYTAVDPTVTFWSPLPQHIWSQISASDLLTTPTLNQTPVGWGPYYVSSWTAGENITLSKNHYFPFTDLSKYGKPYNSFETVIIKFVGTDANNIKLIQDGTCDILDPSSLIGSMAQEIPQSPDYSIFTADGNSWEHLDFGIVPQSYDDGYNVFNDRPNILGASDFRKAISICINKDAIAQAFSDNTNYSIMDSFISPGSSFSSGQQSSVYAPAQGNELLTNLGWQLGADGIRYSFGVTDVLDTTPLTLQYLTLNDHVHTRIAEMISSDLSACGVNVEITTMDSTQFFSIGNSSPVFGRNFDLAQFSWPTTSLPSCELYLSEAIPGNNPEIFPYNWGGWNLTGWSNAEYDLACSTAKLSPSTSKEAQFAYQQAESIFISELPVVPLYVNQQIALTRPDICGFVLDKVDDIYWNIENVGFGDLCP